MIAALIPLAIALGLVLGLLAIGRNPGGARLRRMGRQIGMLRTWL